MASIERTAYPRFRRVVTARELAGLSPAAGEVAWAKERTRSDAHLLALVLSLKCFQRLGYFPVADEVPEAVVGHVRRCLELPEGTAPSCGSRTAKSHRELVRARLGVVYDPKRASWSAFREQVQYLAWVDSLGETDVWLEGVAETKIADFAGEAAAADAGVMRDVAPLKRTALLVCMVHAARTRALDDLAEMFCKRMASIKKRAKTELDDIRARQAEISERLIGHYRDVLAHLDQAQAAGYDCDCRVLNLEHIPRPRVNLDTRGAFKIVAERGSGRILGVHAIADNAGEVILAGVYAVKFGLTVQDLADTWAPYLTMAEGIKLTAQTFTADVDKLSCCAA